MSNGARVFNWEEYINFAKALMSATASEAAKRSAVSRSYYGAFILARNLATERGWVTGSRDNSVHRDVINYYINHPTRKVKQIGTNLDRLRNSRNIADYENFFAKIDENTIKSIRRAEHIKDILGTL